MFYPRVQKYELTPAEQAVFQQESVSVMTDPSTGAGAVINHPVNGLLAGDLFRTRRNPDFDPNRPIDKTNRPLTTWFSDATNVELSVDIAQQHIDEESRTMTGYIGQIALMTHNLPQITPEEDRKRRVLQRALRVIVEAEENARNPQKVDAVTEIERSIKLLESRGGRAPHFAANRLRDALQSLNERESDLKRQKSVSRERREMYRRERAADQISKTILNELCEGGGKIADIEDVFLRNASDRFFKPGSLSVTNAWARRQEPDSKQYLLLAQNGFEPLYGFLMRPMSSLASETRKRFSPESQLAYGELLVKYADVLVKLDDVLDIADIGGDYSPLITRLRAMNVEIQENLISGKIDVAIKRAKDYRMLLRYRALPGKNGRNRDSSEVIHEALEAWYGGLPSVKSGLEPRALPKDIQKDPFKGL